MLAFKGVNVDALVASAPDKEDVSLGKIEVTKQSKESETTQILRLNCTLECTAVFCRSGMGLSLAEKQGVPRMKR